MTRVPELLAAGIPVAFGHDCVMDPWYSLGSADMLEVAHMGLHVAQMTGQEAMRACFRAVTQTPATILGLEGYGIDAGCNADLVLLQARDPVEAIRLRASAARGDPPRQGDRAQPRGDRDVEPAGSSGLDQLSALIVRRCAPWLLDPNSRNRSCAFLGHSPRQWTEHAAPSTVEYVRVDHGRAARRGDLATPAPSGCRIQPRAGGWRSECRKSGWRGGFGDTRLAVPTAAISR